MAEEKQSKKKVKIKKNEKLPVKGTYTAVVCGIMLLVVLAFFGPQIVFAVQDNYQLGRTWQGSRTGLDMEAIYSTYGSLRDRLAAFAERKAEDYEFYVAGTEYNVTSELLELLDVMVAQEGYDMLVGYGVAPYLSAVENRGYTIDEWKKYVIYNDISENASNAIVVSAWYIAFTTRDEVTVKMLIDTETYTLYFMQIIEPNYTEKKAYEYWDWLYETEYFLTDDWLGYWFDYYEAGQTAVQTFEGYMQEGWWKVQTDVNSDEVKNGIVIEYKSQVKDPQRIAMGLPYGDYYLNWQSSVRTSGDKEIPAAFSIGLKDIADLIPELQED